MLLRILTVALIVSHALVASAGDRTTYWNKAFAYGISYPAGWKPGTMGEFMEQDAFSVLSPTDDTNINVMAKRFSPENRGHYRTIRDIPDAEKGLADVIRTDNPGTTVQSGATQLSNVPALWFTYLTAHGSLNREIWVAVYQVSCLKNDIIYTLTAKVVGATQQDAIAKYKRSWPTIEQTLVTFAFAS